MKKTLDLSYELTTIDNMMTRIHKELWELSSQGQIDESNVFSILATIAMAQSECVKAKWQAVQHLANTTH
jgi:hypothetical protein